MVIAVWVKNLPTLTTTTIFVRRVWFVSMVMDTLITTCMTPGTMILGITIHGTMDPGPMAIVAGDGTVTMDGMIHGIMAGVAIIHGIHMEATWGMVDMVHIRVAA